MLSVLNRQPQDEEPLTRHVSRMHWQHGRLVGRSKRRTAVRNTLLWVLMLLLAGCFVLLVLCQ